MRKSVRMRIARRARFKRVTKALFVDGEHIGKIAAAEGVTQQRLSSQLVEYGVVNPGRPNKRMVLAHVREADLAALDIIAAGAGINRSEMISRIVLAALDGNGRPALRLLGKLGKSNGNA